MRTLARRLAYSLLAGALLGPVHAQNIDGRINGFANNKAKVQIPKGVGPVRALAVLDEARLNDELKAFKREVDESIQRRADVNVSWLFWRDGVLVHEAYHRKVTPENHFLGFSITKTVISVAAGKAICEGKLALTDKAVKYLPELQESAYAQATIEQLLLMRSGVPFQETPNAEQLIRAVLAQSDTYDATLLRMKASDYPAKDNPPWNYDTNNTEVLGRALNAATGGLDKYLSETVWSKVGADADAWFAVDRQQRLVSGAGMYAQSRDYLRLGIHVLGLLSADNPDTCLRDYMVRAVSPITSITRPNFYGYGYQVWSRNPQLQDNEGVFEMAGFLGQRVVVDPKTRTVAVALSTAETNLPIFYGLVNKVRRLPMPG